jgi:hypothetical protein
MATKAASDTWLGKDNAKKLTFLENNSTLCADIGILSLRSIDNCRKHYKLNI